MAHNPPSSTPQPGEVKDVVESRKGEVRVRYMCPPEFFDGLELDEGIGSFSRYHSIIQRLDVFKSIASEKDGRVTLALLDDKIVVGYGACWYPRPDERWSALGELMYEMGALEVSRGYRGMGLGRKIFGAIMQDDFFEDKIAYMCGYSWTWDLDGNFLTMAEYRRMMTHFLKDHGFEETYTNEPNLALREENFFMVRIGSRVTEEDKQRFRYLRFGIKPA